MRNINVYLPYILVAVNVLTVSAFVAAIAGIVLIIRNWRDKRNPTRILSEAMKQNAPQVPTRPFSISRWKRWREKKRQARVERFLHEIRGEAEHLAQDDTTPPGNGGTIPPVTGGGDGWWHRNFRFIAIIIFALFVVYDIYYVVHNNIIGIYTYVNWTSVLVGAVIVLAIKFIWKNRRSISRLFLGLSRIDFLFIGIFLVPVIGMFVVCIAIFGSIEGIEIGWELVMFTAIMIPLGIIIGYKKDYIGWNKGILGQWFTPLSTRTYMFVQTGRSHLRTYLNSPDEILKDGEIVPEEYKGQADYERTWIQTTFGQYWIGPEFLGRSKKIFEIPREVEKEKIEDDDTPEAWTITKEPVTTWEFRERTPRPILVKVKFGDNIEMVILVLCNFRGKVPKTVGFTLNGAIYIPLASTIRAGVRDYCQTMTANQFLAADRKDGGEMSKTIAERNNAEMKENIGVILFSLSVPRYETVTTPEEDALEAATLAELNGRAAVAKEKADAEVVQIQAEAEKNRLIIVAQGQAEADRILASASVADVDSLFKSYVEKDVNPNIAAQSATSLGRSQRFTNINSPVHTLVENGGANISLPIEPKRIQPPKPTPEKKTPVTP